VTEREVPTISVAMPAYQAERWIGATLESVLNQTSPPDEVVVVDDGSTDRTVDIARRFGERVRVVQQPNAGVSAAYNRAFRESAGSYVAMCPADDLWEPHKLELQLKVLSANPAVDVAFGGARYFGLEERDFEGPVHSGILDSKSFFRDMYGADLIPAPTAVVRRQLFERLGGFREDLAGEDYEFWMRALKHGALFFHDPRLLVRLRQHGCNLSAQAVSMWEMNLQIHELYGGDLGDERLVRHTLAHDLRTIGRSRLGLGQVDEARDAYRASLANTLHPAALGWKLLLSTPGAAGPLRRLAARRRARAATAR
jgi:glycosyltransferase involved in cell wall biosynthesis